MSAPVLFSLGGSMDSRRESRRWKDPPDKALRAKDIIVKASSLTEDKSTQAVQFLGLALETCGIENEIASFLKKKCDQTFGFQIKISQTQSIAL